MLNLVQESILGIIKCKQRALEVLYWPAMNSGNEEPVKNCTKCADFQRKQLSRLLSPTETPKLPFVMVGTDLFEFESKTYFLTVYNYSKFIEVERLQTPGKNSKQKSTQFSRHGIPEEIQSDGCPQFASKDFARFCIDYGIAHKTSNPPTPTANGEAKRALQTESVSGKKSLISNLPSWTTGEPHWKESTCNQHS